jgi:hypothetical protein
MSRKFKFGILENGSIEHPLPYSYGDQWAEEQTTGPKRLAIGPSQGHITLFRDLSSVMKEPFGILYVLVVPRGDGEPGRYQSPTPLSRQEVLTFLNRFGDFLESDGRHHLWLQSVGESDLLVYDRHNIIYAYGALDGFAKILSTKAMMRTEKIRVPDPHVHCYREEYDSDCRDLLEYWEWKQSPLRDADSR